MNTLYMALSEVIPSDQIRLGEELSRHTTFRVGGPADYFVEPEDEVTLGKVLDLCRQEGIPFFILGNGSNLLVGDLGYRGVIISMRKAWAKIRVEGTCIYAGAGALLSVTAKQALQASLGGFEFAAGIPGTIGGAVVMNAGAYGSEMKSVLKAVTVLTSEGDVKTLPAEALELGYRTSCILRKEYVVLEAELELKQENPEAIGSIMEQLAYERKSKQPLEYPSAGSTFKRPEGYFAGKLIQESGLQGIQIGGAQVSEKHCGFVINRDHASAADIINLCNHVKEQVQERFGVILEMEVKTLGEF